MVQAGKWWCFGRADGKSMGWRSGVCYDDVFLRCGRWGGVVLMSKMPRLLRESLRWYNYRGALYCYLFRFRY